MISALCVTHNRHEFIPWVEHQFYKQTVVTKFHELIIIDSSPEPYDQSRGNKRVYHKPDMPGIAEKRSFALSVAKGDFITWFDDDDWQSPEKFSFSSQFTKFDAVGCRHASMYSTVLGLTKPYVSTYEPLIFNSAVYQRELVPSRFDHSLLTGEDTEWHERFFAEHPSFVVLGTPMHAWLCHEKNITNKSSAHFFERPNDVPFNDWEKGFLGRLRGGRLCA